MTDRIPQLIRIPTPRFQFGDRVEDWSAYFGQGTVIHRTYDNMLYAAYWRYAVKWDDGRRTNQHYCCDLKPL